jgi:putative transposase
LVLPRLAYLTLCRSIQLLALLVRGDAAKDLEILVLRHQLTVLRRKAPRPKLEPADRALLAAISRVLPPACWSLLLRHATDAAALASGLIAGAWTDPHRASGRPRLDADVQQPIIGLAKENPRWGYQRIKGELLLPASIQSRSPWPICCSRRPRCPPRFLSRCGGWWPRRWPNSRPADHRTPRSSATNC